MLLIEFKQGNETYTVSEEGGISKRVITASSFSDSTVHWLDLMPDLQDGILAIARAKGDSYFQKVNKLTSCTSTSERLCCDTNK